ncbi:C-type lectin domain family 12 member B-like [Mytilus galloprovincialis]|uniref:C-type lectin domain family 12 member B-like n=1 Tax=Mytilus galloprovincialis TaxID=29158 RepID=UPI003F7B6B22
MYGSSCYFFSYTSEKWTDAVRICQTKNSILAEIGSSGENGFLKNTASNYGGKFWLGGTDSGREGTGIGGPVVRDSV